ncbi:13E12 repeat family protein, partial [Demequina sp. TTPB684]|nr:13E12 repeat family protein [Demequina sp. TTPB684]
MERRLVTKAVGLTLKDVRRLVDHAVARADLPGHQARERRQFEDRYLTWSEDHTGMVTLNARLDAVTAAPIRTVIEQMVTHQFRQRRDQDPSEQDRRTPGQMRADALHDLARHALGCDNTTSSGVRTTIVVRMKLSDLNSGTGLGSIDGTTQPVSVSELRRLAG